MPSGGRLTLRTLAHDDRVRLEVGDTGVGMDGSIRERLFQPFFTTKENGQGLGTSIIYGIVTRHDGEIEVESEEGKGSRFSFDITLARMGQHRLQCWQVRVYVSDQRYLHAVSPSRLSFHSPRCSIIHNCEFNSGTPSRGTTRSYLPSGSSRRAWTLSFK